MKKDKVKKQSTIIKYYILPMIIFIVICFLGIGYGALTISLDIVGTLGANAQNGIFITNVQDKSSNDALGTIKNYYQNILNSNVILSNKTSTITYTITMYNNTADSYDFLGVYYDEKFYSNNDIEFILDGLKVGDKINSKELLTFTITFKYKNDLTEITNNILDSSLQFEFGEYKITSPTITGGSENWVKSSTVSVLNEGTASDGVKEYEYYLTSAGDVPNISTVATGVTSGEVTISKEGTYKIFYRTVSTNGCRSEWSDFQLLKIDTTNPYWTVENVSTTRMLTTDSFSFTLVGQDAQELENNSLSDSKITFYVDGQQINPMIKNISEPTTKDGKIYYKINVDKLPGSGKLTVSIGEGTLTDKVGNTNDENNIDLSIIVDKNPNAKILIIYENFSSLASELPKYFANVTFDTNLSVEQIIAAKYDVVIFTSRWNAPKVIMKELFNNGINIITSGNDASSETVPFIATRTIVESSTTGEIKRKVVNNLTKYMPENLWKDNDKYLYLSTFTSDTTVLYADENYHYMGLYEENGAKWLHSHIGSYDITYHSPLMVLYVTGQL